MIAIPRAAQKNGKLRPDLSGRFTEKKNERNSDCAKCDPAACRTAVMTAPLGRPGASIQSLDVIIVGAGFAGLYMLHRCRELGLAALAIEAGGDVGGTWYWNRYPGARCDVLSADYSYSFDDAIQQQWTWSERFATQPEILAYLNFVADKLKLRRDILFDTRVTDARYNEEDGTWGVSTDRGDSLEARFLIMASGCLSVPKAPEIPGLSSFSGELFSTARWPHHPVDFEGKRVAVVGTGSSGIQVIPIVADDSQHLYVFQRTPSFTLPARNEHHAPSEIQKLKADYPERRSQARLTPNCGLRPLTDRKAFDVDSDERAAIYRDMWESGGINFGATFSDLVLDESANRTAADFVRARIDEIVDDPRVAHRLKPFHYPIGTRRICLDTDYYATFNRPNVTLIDAQDDPVLAIEPNGVRTRDAFYPVDMLILATGFDAMTGALLAIRIEGRDGASLRDRWADGPASYLGIAIHGFPNLFTITGPGSPSVLSNMVGSIEQHVEWIAALLDHMMKAGHRTVEARLEQQTEWVAHVSDLADRTLLPKANSWYVGANIPGKPRVFMPYVGGCHVYRRACDEIAADGYRGFEFRSGHMDALQSDCSQHFSGDEHAHQD